MTVATEKTKQNSERWTLVRVSGRRDASPSFQSLGGDVFSMTWPDDDSIPYAIWKNDDTQLTKVTTVANDGEWSFSETTRLVTIKTTGEVPDVDYLALVSYYLFYSSHGRGDVDYYEDPDDSTSTVRNWKSRLVSDPSFNLSFSDIVNGVFTVQNSSIELTNIDSEFQQYLSDADSFYLQGITAWLFINGQRQKTYVGKIASLSVNDTVTLNVLDAFTRLDEYAIMGDDGSEKMSSAAAPDDIGKPIPLILARESFNHRTDDSADYTGATDAGEWIDGIPGRCITYTPDQQYALYNREWRLARILNNLDTQSFGTLVRAVNPDATSALFQFSSYDGLRVGDTMRWTNGGVPEYGRIIALGSFTYLGNAYNVRVLGTNNGFPPTANAASVVVPLKCLSVWIEGAESTSKTGYGLVYLYQGAQYSITETTLASGNVSVKITIIDNAESDVGIDMTEVIDPTRHRLKFTLRTVGVDVNHAVNLKRILDAAGVATNAASFTQAASDLVEDTKFMIPNLDETEFGPYRKYVTDLLQGTLGYLRANNDGEAEYKLLALPAAGDTKDGNIVLDQDVTVEVEYQDIQTRLTGINQHLPITGTRSLTTHRDARAEVLHGIVNPFEMKHYMSNHDPGRWEKILGIRASRRVKYGFRTATDDIDTLLGDDATLETPKILGGDGTKDVKVIEIEKSADGVGITSSDLLGL